MSENKCHNNFNNIYIYFYSHLTTFLNKATNLIIALEGDIIQQTEQKNNNQKPVKRRKLRLDDAEAIFEYASNAKVFDPPQKSVEDSVKLIKVNIV